MALQMGIVGLPNVGKSTLLNALTHAHAESSNYPFCTIDKNVGVAVVDDPRLARLAELLRPQETIPSAIRFVDIAGLVRGASKGEGLGNQFLGHIREVDAIVHLVRCFDSERIVHVDGSIDPIRDIGTVEAELMLADLDTVERHRSKVEHRAKGNPKEVALELSALDHLLPFLKRGEPLRHVELPADAMQKARELFLLSIKPLVVVANVSEDDPGGRSDVVERLRSGIPRTPLLPLAVSLEEEIAHLDPQDRDPMLRDLDLPARGIDRLLEISRTLLQLITFYTTANEKLQAWLVSEGTKAPAAAGRIHTDMERGFIRTEVFRLEDLEALGSRGELHRHGKIRTEGKEYIVRDGDICHILFQPR